MNLESLLVRKGDRVTVSKWNGLVKFVMMNRILKGHRLLPRQTGHGVALHVRDGATWFHAWKTVVNGTQATINTGTVNGNEPMISTKKGFVPLSDPSQPSMTLSPALYDAQGKSWIAIEITLDDERNIKTDLLKVIQCANIEVDDGKSPLAAVSFSQGIRGFERDDAQVVRYPIVRLILRAPGTAYYQVSYFNLQYKNDPPPANPDGSIGSGPGRHFFWPT